jgi:Ion channel
MSLSASTFTKDHDRVGQLFSYAIVGVAPPGTDLIYFAFVNYTTLGYGDVTPLRRWQLLGPMTAMNGVLLFGGLLPSFLRSCGKQ